MEIKNKKMGKKIIYIIYLFFTPIISIYPEIQLAVLKRVVDVDNRKL
jgi:hypothetical protein